MPQYITQQSHEYTPSTHGSTPCMMYMMPVAMLPQDSRSPEPQQKQFQPNNNLRNQQHHRGDNSRSGIMFGGAYDSNSSWSAAIKNNNKH
mmetsp:Transcript_11933/g.10211  ORF Transcript_11933/g.10211 Transcript_11933/m.10211 type:complete len:90 (-) Transcript_11933:59-328(-)